MVTAKVPNSAGDKIRTNTKNTTSVIPLADQFCMYAQTVPAVSDMRGDVFAAVNLCHQLCQKGIYTGTPRLSCEFGMSKCAASIGNLCTFFAVE